MSLFRLNLVPVLIGLLMLSVVGACYAQTTSAQTQVFLARLTALNNSSASGEAIVSRQGDLLTVIIYAEDMEVGQPHPQHIHGFDDDRNATCPTLAQDDDDDHLVQVGEGRDTYGPIQLPLKPFPVGQPNQDNTQGATANPPTGDVMFVHTYTIGSNGDISEAALTPLVRKHVVLHGETVNGQYQPTLPVACGQLVAQPQNPRSNGANGNPQSNGANGIQDIETGNGGCSIWNRRGPAPDFDPLWALLLLAGMVGAFRFGRRGRRRAE